VGCGNPTLNIENVAPKTKLISPKELYIPIEFNSDIQKNPEVAFCSLAEKEQFELEILRRINEYRSQSGVCGDAPYTATPPLKWNQLLFQSSIINSMNLAGSNIISHTNVDGKEVGDKFRLSPYEFSIAMENIAAGQSRIDEVMKAWKESPGHCKNMIDARVTEVAAACTYKKKSFYKYYWTMHLGAPIAPKPKEEIQIENKADRVKPKSARDILDSLIR
jgi:uncharacterized protein YkwD